MLDFGQGIASPYCAMLLVVYGADVIKVEPPDFASRADSADALIPQLRDVFLIQSAEAWLTRLHAADIIAERILNPGEWLRNAHVEATKAAVCQDTPRRRPGLHAADARGGGPF